VSGDRLDDGWQPSDRADGDVVQGRGRPSSRRAAVVILTVGALLLAEPAWHALSAAGPAPRPRTVAVRTPAAPVTAPPDVGRPDDRPPVSLGGRGLAALLRWHRALPFATARPPRRPTVHELFRVVPGARDAGVDGPDQVGQVRVGGGWVDVEHGNLGPAVLAATGAHLAVMVRRRDLSRSVIRQWLDVVALDDALAITSTRVTVGSTVLGWFGPYVVVQPPVDAGVDRPVRLIDGTGRGPARVVSARVTALDDGRGDVQLRIADEEGCASLSGLGLGARRGLQICPDDELLALSPDGAWGMTRDLRWVDVATSTYRPLAGRPVGHSARTIDVVADGTVLLRFSAGRRTLTALCSRDGCARLP